MGGEYFTDSTDSTADATCTPCPRGQFKAEKNADIKCAPKKTECPAGQFFTPSTDSTADATCTACPRGQFKAETNDKNCEAHRTCSPGSYESTAPSATNDRE